MVTNPSAGTDPPRENTHRRMGVPTFIETAPGSFKPIEECSKGEIAREIMALLARAEATMDEASRSETPGPGAHTRSLLYEAKALSDYLNV